jgi:hypothetical protein
MNSSRDSRSVPLYSGKSKTFHLKEEDLSSVLYKITGEKCRIIVIAPAWPKQAWFANLLRLSCARPLVLPLKRNLLSQFKGV